MVEKQRPAAIYVRVSRQAQADNYSPETQEQACRDYATEHGFAVDPDFIYREVYTGAALDDRPQLSRLREAVSSGKVSAVIAYHPDRLSRNQQHDAVLQYECTRMDVALLTVQGQFADSPEGVLMRSITSFVAESERQRIRERTQRGLMARMKSGMPMGGCRPLYGYQWRDDEKSGYEINPDTAPIVRRIFADYAAGKSLRAISIELTNEAIPTATGQTKWSHTTIQWVLRHPGYTGRLAALRYVVTKGANGGWRHDERPEEEQIPLPAGTMPPLIDDDIFEAVQQRLDSNKVESQGRLSNPEDFLLRAGFLRCGYCGNALSARMQRRSGKARKDEKVARYFNGDNDTHRGCKNISIDAAIIDEAVWRRVEAVLTHPEIIASELERLRENDNTEAEIALVDKQLVDIARKMQNLIRRISDIDDDERAAPFMAEYSALEQSKAVHSQERSALITERNNREAAATDLANLERWCRALAASLASLTYEKKRLALKALRVRVKLYSADHSPRFEIIMSLPGGKEITDQFIDASEQFLYGTRRSSCVRVGRSSRGATTSRSGSRLRSCATCSSRSG